MSKKFSDKKNPKVSIIIPFYNRERFLGEAIESVLSQTVDDWELILVNDGSMDKSVEIAKEYSKKYPSKIKVLNHPENQNKGASLSRNLGIKNSNGKYVTFLDSDDIFFSNTLEKELAAFKENSNADAVCGTAVCWFSWSNDFKGYEKDFVIDLVLETNTLYQPPELFIHNMKAGGRKAHTNCMMLKKEFAQETGVFKESYNVSWEDQISWAKLTLNGNIYVLDDVLAKYRLHKDSICAIESQTGNEAISIKIFLDWLDKYLKKQNIQDKKVWNSFKGFRRKVYLEKKFWKLKDLYRNHIPLHLRYKIRDRLTKVKKALLWSSNRQK